MDHCAVFGNQASGRLWCLFFGLVCWIAIHEFGIQGVLHYVDDAFKATFDNQLSFYHPYKHSIPHDQAQFLCLLDHIGVPHNDAKQVHGACLEIIGFIVDANELLISMSPESKQKLIDSL